ncbi:MAG: flavin reductase family protein [Desulfurococcaceae archaeon]
MFVLYKIIDPTDYHVLHPRPVYLIVSKSKTGAVNVMSASWVSPVSDEPFIVAVSIWKGSLTYQNIKETGEFTINIPSEKHLDIVYKAGTISGREIDKISTLGLRLAKSSIIEAPGLEDMLGFLECRVINEIEVGESALFLAEVKTVHVVEEMYTRYGWDLSKAKILLHNGGRGFTTPYKLILARR